MYLKNLQTILNTKLILVYYIEEDIELKNKLGIKKLPDPISIREAASKNYVDNILKVILISMMLIRQSKLSTCC